MTIISKVILQKKYADLPKYNGKPKSGLNGNSKWIVLGLASAHDIFSTISTIQYVMYACMRKVGVFTANQTKHWFEKILM